MRLLKENKNDLSMTQKKTIKLFFLKGTRNRKKNIPPRVNLFRCSVAFFSLVLQMGQRGLKFQENKPGMCPHFWTLATTMVQHRCGKSLASNKNGILKGKMLHHMPLLLFYFRYFMQQPVSNTPQQSPRWATDVPVPRFQVPLVPEIFHTPLSTGMS